MGHFDDEDDASQDWYYARDGVQIGPVSFDQLVAAARDGRFDGGDLVWREGMADWQPASTVPGLPFERQAPRAPDPEMYDTAPAPASTGQLRAPVHVVAQHPQHPQPQQQQQQPPTYVPSGVAAPQLGYAGPVGYGEPQAPSYMGLAIGGFVCTLVALPLACCIHILSLPLSVTGLILAVVAKRGMNRTGNLQGNGLAIAGIVIGIIEIVLSVGMLLLYAIVAATGN